MNAGRIPHLSRLLAAACGALFALPFAAQADRNPTTESKSLHEWASLDSFSLSGTGVTNYPGPIHPIPLSTAGVSGSNPVNIPVRPIFFPFRSGNVDLTATLRSGTTSGIIDVSVTGYNAGTYTVSAVTESSSSTVVLGTLTVVSGSFPIWSGSNPILYGTAVHDNAGPAIIPEPPIGLASGQAIFGGTAAPFPSGFSPFDVATLSLTDSNNSLVSTATLTPVPDGYYTALSPLTAGTAAPSATGYGFIRANTPPLFLPLAVTAASKSGIIIDPLPPIFRDPKTGQIVIHAHGLPASTTLTYAADGTDLGTATTDASGNLTVFAAQGNHRKLPATLDLFSVKTITVHDASGTVYVSASF